MSYINGDLANLTDYNFLIIFKQDATNYLRLPLVALMRDNSTVSSPECILLVTSLNETAGNGESFLIGEAWFQNYKVAFLFNDDKGLDNQMVWTPSPIALLGTTVSS